MIAYSQGQTLGRESTIKQLRLDLKGAENFPNWIFNLSKLEEIHLFNAQFGQVHFTSWPWPQLNKLQLVDCGLSSMAYSGADTLPIRLLDLSKNPGLSWPTDYLQHALQLNTLHFSHNELAETSLPTLAKSRQLRQLHLEQNKLSRIPTEVFQLKQLRILNLSDNQIVRVPKALGKLEQLDHLILDNNRIRVLPDAFGTMTALNQLQLSNNRLSSLPVSIQDCLVLRKLNLSKNKFQSFPAFLTQLPWLSELDLSTNKLKALPTQAGVFRQLSQLVLNQNRLSTFSWTAAQLPKLRTLQLDQNQLTDLPTLPSSLLFLHARANQFTAIPNTVLGMPDLKDLFLEKNKIDQLPEDFKQLQKSLIRFGMAGNPVRSSVEVLLGLRELKEINGLLRAAQRRDLLLAQQTARTLHLPTNLSESFYKLLRSDLSVLSDLGANGILLALNHPVGKVVAKVRQFVQKQYGLTSKGHRLKKGSIVAILGRTFFNIVELEKRLSALGIKLLPDYQPDLCTHLLLGFPILKQEIPPAKQVILNERQFVLRLDQLEKKTLLKEKSVTKIKRLRQLLTSPDTTNIQLGFRMIKGNGLPPVLWNELLVAYYLCERDPALQLQLKSFIRLRLVDQGKNRFFAALTPQLIKWGKIKPEKEKLLRRNRFDLELVQGYLKGTVHGTR